jgi:hypothetical protein
MTALWILCSVTLLTGLSYTHDQPIPVEDQHRANIPAFATCWPFSQGF